MSVEIGKETTAELQHGHKTVGTTAVQLTDLKFSLVKGILLRAPGSADPIPNTAPVWVGSKAVTANSAATGGMPIPPGEVLIIPIDDPSKLWLVSAAGGQDIAWMAL